MGPCQGRFCGATIEQIFAHETALGAQAVGHFNVRPPVKPVTLGQLAGSVDQADQHENLEPAGGG
jgi:hypothetical protein